MNFLPLVFGFLLYKLLPSLTGNKGTQKSGGETTSKTKNSSFGSLEEIQSALQLVSLFNKLKENKADFGDVMGEVMSNPLAMELLGRFGAFGNKSEPKTQSDNLAAFNDKEEPRFSQEESSPNESQDKSDNFSKKEENSADIQTEQENFNNDELFKPVENIAGVELTEKLKKYYDNWYVK